jgi:glycosyltransferase involved in cell wall biosynthesis
MSSDLEISIVVPIYNEAPLLPELFLRLSSVVSTLTAKYELILVNDGSQDGSLLLLQEFSQRDARVKYLSFSRNFGHQVAIMAGLDHAAGKAVVIIDGDLQDPPEVIESLYAKYRQGYKIVYAKRRSRAGETWFKKVTASAFYRLMARITSIEIPLDTGDFRIIDRIVVEELKRMPESNKFLRGQIAWMGYRQSFVEYDRQERKVGTSGYSLGKMLRLALDGVTAFSNFPLRLASWSGFVVSLAAFFIILYALYAKFVLHQVITGWTSLIISSMFIGGIQLLALGIIGEYISRINVEVKKRPLYIVEESSYRAQ